MSMSVSKSQYSSHHIDTKHPAVQPVLEVLEKQQSAHFFLQRKFNLLLFGALFIISILSLLYAEAKIENHTQANLLSALMAPEQGMHAAGEEESE